MQTSLLPTRTFTLGAETPGLSLVASDDGNWTGGKIGVGDLVGSSCGVSAPVLSNWLGQTATAADMRAVTPVTMQAIFGANYWNRLNADALPVGLDLQVVDHGYNRGQASSAMLLQRLLGQQVDGWIGAETLRAVSVYRPTAPLPLAILDVDALQEGLGVAQDGVVGPVTRAAFVRLSPAAALLAALYAAQVRDYRGLPDAAENRGWFVRARDRLARARSLRAAA